MIGRIAKAAGLPHDISPHSLRHVAIAKAIDAPRRVIRAFAQRVTLSAFSVEGGTEVQAGPAGGTMGERCIDRESGKSMSEVPGAHGGCLCGGIRYTVRGALREVINCHCERCRRFTGHHMATTSARLDDINVEDENALLTWFFPVPEAGYGFCSGCGSSLFWQSSADAARRAICAGTLDPPTGLRTVQAWWVSQASDYHARPDLTEVETE